MIRLMMNSGGKNSLVVIGDTMREVCDKLGIEKAPRSKAALKEIVEKKFEQEVTFLKKISGTPLCEKIMSGEIHIC